MSLGIGVVAGSQDADEDLGLVNLAGVRVDDGDRLPRIVHKDFLTSFVGKAHGGLQALGPLPVQGTELAVPIAIRMGFAILDPQQTQGHTLLVQLRMHDRPVGAGDDTRTELGSLGEQELVQGILAHVRRERPAQPRFLGAP